MEIQQPDGTPFPEFALKNSVPIYGDDIDRVVKWIGDPDLKLLAGQPVRLRFAMQECDLYALRFE